MASEPETGRHSAVTVSRPRTPLPRGICPTCLTERSVASHGIQNHNVPRTSAKRGPQPRCAGSGAPPLVGDRAIAKAKALLEAKTARARKLDAADAALAPVERAYEAARRANDMAHRSAYQEYDRRWHEIEATYPEGATNGSR